MKTFIKSLGLAAMLSLALLAGPARAQDEQNTDNTPPPQNSDATAPPSDQSNVVPNDNTAPQSGDNNVSFQTFYDQLAGQGTWIQTDKYGYVFQPTESDPNWRPYTYGHWVNTDAGMTWDSDEPFGWATYHYGRWANLDGYGWVWVPGYTWAPAWVSWRQGDDDVGWAPLPMASMWALASSASISATTATWPTASDPVAITSARLRSSVTAIAGGTSAITAITSASSAIPGM
jgi:hypothetical protein